MVKDHLGHPFNSVQNMYLFWGLTEREYYERKWAGWSLEKVLTTSHRIKPDENGKPIEKPTRPNAQHRLINTTRKRIEGGFVTIREYQRG